MSEQEFKTLAATLQTIYSKEERFLSDPNAVMIWFDFLKDLPYDLTAQTVAEWIGTNQWSPTIADIRNGVTEKLRKMFPDEKSDDWGAAYDNFLRSVRMYGVYREAEGMAMLDELTRAVVNGIGGYKALCMSENPESDRANFRMLYEARMKRAEQQSKAEELPRLLARYQESIGSREERRLEG